MSAPIAVFAYRRADRLRAMLASLERCDGFYESPVIIFVDGPRSDKDRADVAAVRSVVESLPWRHLTIEESDQNRGLKNSIFAGVSKVTEQYGRAIVLEDDLILSPAALRFFNAGLEKYESNSKVWSVAGYMYNAGLLRRRSAAFFLPFALPWGWATWHESWRQFDPNAQPSADLLNSDSFKRAFSMGGLGDFASMLRLAIEGKIDSWFVRWYYTVFSHGGLSLFPPTTFVRNSGWRGGTHASRLNPYDLLVRPASLARTMPDLPEEIVVDEQAVATIRRSWEARVLRGISVIGSIRRRKKSIGVV